MIKNVIIMILSIGLIVVIDAFEEIRPNKMSVRVHWVVHQNLQSVHNYCGSDEDPELLKTWTIHGCATFDLVRHTCTIHAVEPDPKQEEGVLMTYLGHELYHCFVGQFHPTMAEKEKQRLEEEKKKQQDQQSFPKGLDWNRVP